MEGRVGGRLPNNQVGGSPTNALKASVVLASLAEKLIGWRWRPSSEGSKSVLRS